MMKKVMFMIACLTMSVIIGGCADSNVAQKLSLSAQEEVVDSAISLSNAPEETFHSSVGFSKDTSFEVSIAPQRKASAGGEMWEKGDEIIFTIFKSDQITEVEVGICPVKEEYLYNYDEFTSKVVTIGPDEQEISITVPETDKYGIVFVNKMESAVSFEGKTNKKIENPFL